MSCFAPHFVQHCWQHKQYDKSQSPGVLLGGSLSQHFTAVSFQPGCMLAEVMLSMYNAEPEMIPELVALVQTEAPSLDGLRALAVRALSAQVQDRSRYTAVIAGISGGAGQGSGLLSVLLHKVRWVALLLVARKHVVAWMHSVICAA